MAGLPQNALGLARRGWPIIPLHTPIGASCSCGGREGCRPGKHPRIRDPYRNASADLPTVAGWWTSWPEANVGIGTGGAVGPIVLDVDGPEGEARLSRLSQTCGALPPGPEVRTGKGRHLYFAPEPSLTSWEGRHGDGLDLRASGGLVVAPPSLHASGRVYVWEPGRPAPVPLPPSWIAALRTQPPPARAPSIGHPRTDPDERRRYAEAALASAVDRIRSSPPGGNASENRHRTLYREVAGIAELVWGGLLDRARVEAVLEAAALEAGQVPREVRRAVDSAMERGADRPRSSPPPLPSGDGPPVASAGGGDGDALADPDPWRGWRKARYLGGTGGRPPVEDEVHTDALIRAGFRLHPIARADLLRGCPDPRPGGWPFGVRFAALMWTSEGWPGGFCGPALSRVGELVERRAGSGLLACPLARVILSGGEVPDGARVRIVRGLVPWLRLALADRETAAIGLPLGEDPRILSRVRWPGSLQREGVDGLVMP